MAKRKFIYFGDRFFFRNAFLDENQPDPTILAIRSIIPKKSNKKKFLFLFAIILAGILAGVLYVVLKPFVCDCLNNGNCLKDGTCNCSSGFNGDKCQNYDICWSNPCKGEGKCNAINRTYFNCSCGNKFNDLNCQSNYQYPVELLLDLSNSDQIATQFSNKTVKIWSNNLTQSFFIDLNPIKTSISSMNQMNQLLLIGTCDSNIQIVNLTNLNTTSTIQTNGCVNALTVIDFGQDKYLISTSDKTLQIWDSDLKNVANLTSKHTNTITSLAFNPNSSLLASSAADQSIIVWNLASYQSLRSAYLGKCNDCFIVALTLLPNGNIVGGSYDVKMPSGNLYVWNQTTLSFKVLKNNFDYVLALVTLKNDMFAVGYGFMEQGQIEIWNSTSLDLITNFNQTGLVLVLIMLPNGNLASAGTSNTITIWNTTTFKEISNWDAHLGYIFCLAILPINENLISGSQDSTIKIWDSNKNYTLFKVIKVFETVYSLAVLSDGNLAAGIFSTLSYWNMTSFQLITNLDSHSDVIFALTLLPDGSLLSGSNDATIKIWKNYQLINTLKALDKIFSILVLDDFKFLTGITNNTIQFWEKNENISNINSLTTLKGHTDEILTISFLNNTNYLASGSKDLTIKIWDLLKLRICKTLLGHLDAVTTLINLSNMRFASGSLDKTILIWSIQQEFQNNYNLTSHLGGINSLIYLKKQNYLLSASKDVSTILWNINSDLTLKYQLNGHSLSVEDVTELENNTLMSCSNDLNLISWNYISNNSNYSFKTNHKDYIYAIVNINNLVVTGSKDLTIKIWNQSFLISTLYGHLKPVISLLALTNKILASGSCDSTIRIWDITSFKLFRTLTGHKDCVNTLSLYGSQIMLSGSSDKKIIVWNITNLNNLEIITHLIGHENAVNSIDTYENRLIASSSQDSTIKIWSSAYSVIKTLTNHTDSVFSLAVLNNGNLVSGSQDHSIKIWDKNTFELLYTLTNHSGTVSSLVVLQNGLLISGSWDTKIIVWNNTNIIKTITNHTGSITGLFVLNNGNFVSCSLDYRVKLWNKNTFEILASKLNNNGLYQPYSLTGLQNDSGIAYGDNSGSIYILDPDSLNNIFDITSAHESTVWALTILQNGNLVSCSADNLIKIWHKKTFGFVISLVGHDSYVFSIVTMNSNVLLSASADNSIKIWNTETWELLETCKGHIYGVNSLIVGQKNGTMYFASASEDNTIKIWEKNDFQNIATLNGHSDSVNAVKFLNNGLLVSASQDKSIKLWELISFKNIASKKNAHLQTINSLKTSIKSNKNYLISSGADKNIKIWDTDLFLNITNLL